MAQFYSFLWLSNIPLYMCTTASGAYILVGNKEGMDNNQNLKSAFYSRWWWWMLVKNRSREGGRKRCWGCVVTIPSKGSGLTEAWAWGWLHREQQRRPFCHLPFQDLPACRDHVFPSCLWWSSMFCDLSRWLSRDTEAPSSKDGFSV